MTSFPGVHWTFVDPTDAGFDPHGLQKAEAWMDQQAAQKAPSERQYRVVVVRGGHVVAEWNRGIARSEQLQLASATKSIFSSILGIVIHEGNIPSADARVVDYYPEMMDVPPGTGPKPGRHAFAKDRDITFRQLISNTSGYMKPDEAPGRVFHYQTYGMNILTHAIAKIHGLYDVQNPDESPGLRPLIDEKLRRPIGASWGYYLANFNLHPDARQHIFGYYDGVQSTALDMARLGWLWCNEGRWHDQQIIPADWLRAATHVAPAIRAHAPPEQWKYGYGFWSNEHGLLWPSLPRDAFAASGAGRQHIWVCPSLDMVVVQSPGLYGEQEENDSGLLRLLVDALT